MRVLVTGAGGFVGRHLVPRLEADGHAVIPRDLDLDVTDRAAVGAALAEIAPEAVVHLAGQASVAASVESARQTFRVNYLGAHHVLAETFARAPTARVLFVSSGEVYGSAPTGAPPFDEAAPLAPGSPYARTKAAADLLCGDLAARGLDVVRVRPFNHTGPGQSDGFVAPSFARRIAMLAHAGGDGVLRVGNLESTRDFLDVRDVVDAYARLLDRRVPAGVYNVASGRALPVGELLDRLLRGAAITPRVERDDAFYRPTNHAAGSADRLTQATGWEQRIPLDVTLRDLLDDWITRTASA